MHFARMWRSSGRHCCRRRNVAGCFECPARRRHRIDFPLCNHTCRCRGTGSSRRVRHRTGAPVRRCRRCHHSRRRGRCSFRGVGCSCRRSDPRRRRRSNRGRSCSDRCTAPSTPCAHRRGGGSSPSCTRLRSYRDGRCRRGPRVRSALRRTPSAFRSFLCWCKDRQHGLARVVGGCRLRLRRCRRRRASRSRRSGGRRWWRRRERARRMRCRRVPVRRSCNAREQERSTRRARNMRQESANVTASVEAACWQATSSHRAVRILTGQCSGAARRAKLALQSVTIRLSRTEIRPMSCWSSDSVLNDRAGSSFRRYAACVRREKRRERRRWSRSMAAGLRPPRCNALRR